MTTTARSLREQIEALERFAFLDLTTASEGDTLKAPQLVKLSDVLKIVDAEAARGGGAPPVVVEGEPGTKIYASVIPDHICGICYHPFDRCSHCDARIISPEGTP